MNIRQVPEQLASITNSGKTPLNVILITLDDFSYELFMENLESLPNLKALKRDSVFFENAFSIGPTTHFAFPGIVASVYPYHFGIGIDKNITGIDEVFKKRGYNTAFINECNMLLSPYFGYGMNTDCLKHVLNLDNPEDEGCGSVGNAAFDTKDVKGLLVLPGLPRVGRISRKFRFIWRNNRWVEHAKEYCLGALLFLKNHRNDRGFLSMERQQKLHQKFRKEVLGFINGQFNSPQFLWIHTIINHWPYLPSENSSEFNASEVNYLNYRALVRFVDRRTARRLKRLYIESLKVTDSFVGAVFDALRTNNLLDHSLVVITADHGEEFMEEGYYGHRRESSSDRLLRVPLIFYCPNFLQSKRIESPVSTIDILPTICDLSGMKIPDSCRGLSLKKLLLHMTEDPKECREFWQRPLFSESWEAEDLLDRSAGYTSSMNIFTVRKDAYKLRVVQYRRSNNTIIEKLNLINWVNKERLSVKSNRHIVDRLKNLLDNHIDEEGVFAQRIRSDAEKRRIKDAASKVKSRVQR